MGNSTKNNKCPVCPDVECTALERIKEFERQLRLDDEVYFYIGENTECAVRTDKCLKLLNLKKQKVR